MLFEGKKKIKLCCFLSDFRSRTLSFQIERRDRSKEKKNIG